MTATTIGCTVVRSAGMAAAVGFVGIALFQFAIAAGAPLGPAAWGGTHIGSLPAGLRIASGVAVIAWTFTTLVVLRRVGMGPLAMTEATACWSTWVLFGLLLVISLMNFASPSAWERYFWGPYALVLAGLCLLPARSDGP